MTAAFGAGGTASGLRPGKVIRVEIESVEDNEFANEDSHEFHAV